MLRKPKAIKGNLVLYRVESTRNTRLGGNIYCSNCVYYSGDRCKLIHTESIDNYSLRIKAYQFCLKVTPAYGRGSGWSRKLVYIYVEEKKIL